MKRLIMLITAVALLSGCGLFQKVFKHKVSEKTLTSSSKSEIQEIAISIQDSSITTVIERIDTTVQTKEVKGESDKKLDLNQIKDGLRIIDDEFFTLNQKYDPIDSTLKTTYVLKPQKVYVRSFKKTEVKNNIKTHIKQNSKKESEEQTENKKSEVLVDRKPDYNVIIFLIIGVILLGFVCWLIKTKNIL